jgi:C4-dicarboxylate-binding protein DctP
MTERASKGLRVLPGMWANSGLRVLGMSKKLNREVRVPADLKGVKIRITASKVEQQAFALTPASPVAVNWGETYQAVQQGVVDALHVGLGPLSAARIPENIGTATRLNMSFNAHVAVVGRKWFDGLPAPVRESIERAARESWTYQKAEQRKANDLMWGEWKAAGIKVHDLTADERKAWFAALGHTRPEWNSHKERYGKALYERIAQGA